MVAPRLASASRYALGEKLRRLARAAAVSNSVDAPPLSPDAAWQASTAYTTGRVVRNGGRAYVCLTSGTSAASGGPATTTSGDATADGTCNWSLIGGAGLTAADAVAPTLTTTTTIPADMTNGDLRPTYTQLRGYGGDISAVAGNRWRIAAYDTALGVTEYGKGTSFAFQTDDPRFCVEQVSGTEPYRFIIDGRLFTVGSTPVNAATQYHTFDFGARSKRRTIIVDAGRQAAFLGRVFVTVRGQIWQPPETEPIKAAFISDSEIEGSTYGPALPGNTVSQVCARSLGWSNPRSYVKAGTGWRNKGSGSAFYTYRERLPQVLAWSPDLIVFFDATNDYSTNYTAASVTAEVLACLQDIRAGGSTAPIIVFGTLPLNTALLGAPASAASDVEAAVAAGVAAFTDPLSRTWFIPLVADPILPWISGPHNNSHNTSSTNISLYIGGDNQHLVDAGTTYIGQRMADAIANTVLPAI